MGKGLVTPQLKRELEAFAPQLVIYCPTACATLNALFRHRRLQKLMKETRCALLSLQHRSYSKLILQLLKYLRPWRLIILSRRSEEMYRSLGFDVLRIKAGVDLDVFHPVDDAQSLGLRGKLGLGAGSRIILHVGHLVANRGLERLKALSAISGTQVVVIASTATDADLDLKDDIVRNGIHLIHGYIQNIHEYYQASDVYVFPVEDSSGSIEFPLSVLEAMSCNLRVVSTPFGALPEHFPEAPGLHYLRRDEKLASAVEDSMLEEPDTRRLVREFDWEHSIAELMEKLLEDADR